MCLTFPNDSNDDHIDGNNGREHWLEMGRMVLSGMMKMSYSLFEVAFTQVLPTAKTHEIEYLISYILFM